jgi:hypothetical protein
MPSTPYYTVIVSTTAHCVELIARRARKISVSNETLPVTCNLDLGKRPAKRHLVNGRGEKKEATLDHS